LLYKPFRFTSPPSSLPNHATSTIWVWKKKTWERTSCESQTVLPCFVRDWWNTLYTQEYRTRHGSDVAEKLGRGS
jgi:hypothetical protein